jgi:hypothetical protein
MRKISLGHNHPNTISSMGDLSLVHCTLGCWDKAEELGRHVLKERKRLHGIEHPLTITSINNLVCIVWTQGYEEEAISLTEECIRLQTRVIGPDHPDTLKLTEFLNEWRLANLHLNE